MQGRKGKERRKKGKKTRTQQFQSQWVPCFSAMILWKTGIFDYSKMPAKKSAFCLWISNVTLDREPKRVIDVILLVSARHRHDCSVKTLKKQRQLIEESPKTNRNTGRSY